MHRYALLGTGVHEHLEHEGIHVRYVPANPGLYAFPMMTRKLPPGQTSVRPGVGRGDTGNWHWTAPRGCEGYDKWGYGLGGLHEIAAETHIGPERERITVSELLDALEVHLETKGAKAMGSLRSHLKPVRERFGHVQAVRLTGDLVRPHSLTNKGRLR